MRIFSRLGYVAGAIGIGILIRTGTLLAVQGVQSHDASLGTGGGTLVWFSPHGGCTEAVVDAVGRSRKTILVQAYSFTSLPIARALVAARDRGVDVRVILDKSQRTEQYSGLGFLVQNGIRTWVDAAHPIAHNKVMIIDGEQVLTGSFNFTKGGELNAENLILLKDVGLARAFTRNWEAHLEHSERP